MNRSISKYQELTNKILKEATNSSNSADDYANPLRAIEMQGYFFRQLKTHKKYNLLRKSIALLFFIFPATIAIVLLLKVFDWTDISSLYSQVVIVILSILSLLAGFKLLFKI